MIDARRSEQSPGATIGRIAPTIAPETAPETAPARVDGAAPRVAVGRPVMLMDEAGRGESVAWGIAVEAPVEIAFNGTPWTVMLATPSDLEDLAVGLAITERVVHSVHDLNAVRVSTFLQDVSVNLEVPDDRLDRSAMRSRALLGSTACGLCGVESLAELHRRAEARPALLEPVANAAILRAFAALPAHQPIHAATRSVHAAAWCAPDGTIVLAREDVGRHNALDKLIGALARADRLGEPGFVIMSSRCSYELVAKAAAANTQLLVTVSAPTSLALEWAEALQLPLASVVRHAGGARVARVGAGAVEVPHAG